MTLQPIEPNTLADATVVMANFNDLQNQITALALRIAGAETNITTLTTSISNLETRVTALEEADTPPEESETEEASGGE